MSRMKSCVKEERLGPQCLYIWSGLGRGGVLGRSDRAGLGHRHGNGTTPSGRPWLAVMLRAQPGFGRGGRVTEAAGPAITGPLAADARAELFRDGGLAKRASVLEAKAA